MYRGDGDAEEGHLFRLGGLEMVPGRDDISAEF